MVLWSEFNFTEKIDGRWLMAGPCMKYVLLFPGESSRIFEDLHIDLIGS